MPSEPEKASDKASKGRGATTLDQIIKPNISVASDFFTTTFANAHPIAPPSPEKWPAHRLLRQTNMDWSHWHEGQTWSKDFYAEGMEFNDASVLLTAAGHGVGIALARLTVAWEKLHRGELVLAAPLCVNSFSSHFLMVREDTASLPAVAAFAKWIKLEAQLWQARLAFFDQHSSTKI